MRLQIDSWITDEECAFVSGGLYEVKANTSLLLFPLSGGKAIEVYYGNILVFLGVALVKADNMKKALDTSVPVFLFNNDLLETSNYVREHWSSPDLFFRHL